MKTFLLVGAVGLSLMSPSVCAQWDWEFDPNPPVAGSSLTVHVNSAEGGGPVTVTLQIDGYGPISCTIPSLPGFCTLAVPAGSSGNDYNLTVKSPTDSDSRTGQIN